MKRKNDTYLISGEDFKKMSKLNANIVILFWFVQYLFIYFPHYENMNSEYNWLFDSVSVNAQTIKTVQTMFKTLHLSEVGLLSDLS